MNFLMLFFLIFAKHVFADAHIMTGKCGEYKILGRARVINNTPVIIVNERTMSEYVLSIPVEEEPKLAPYINRHFKFSGTIEKKLNGTKGEIKLLKELELVVPNPLNGSKDSGLMKIKDISCKI
jgi:hypothetical protein